MNRVRSASERQGHPDRGATIHFTASSNPEQKEAARLPVEVQPKEVEGSTMSSCGSTPAGATQHAEVYSASLSESYDMYLNA